MQANCDGDNPYGTTQKGANVRKTTPVGSYDANAWGLYDMHGNVSEWCRDRYGDYPDGPVTDPSGQAGSNCVIRGGRWDIEAAFCRSASRYRLDRSLRSYGIGFRLALSSSGIPK